MRSKFDGMDREKLLADLKFAYEEGGLTIRELATLYGVSYGAMHFRLTSVGVALRPRSGNPPISDPVVPPRSVACPKCHAKPYERCRNSYSWHINSLHVARRRAAAEPLDNPCET